MSVHLIITVCLSVQSIIMPVYNAACWLDECLQAIMQQDFTGTMQLSVFDDASTVSLFLQVPKQGGNSPKLTSTYRMFSHQDDSRASVEGWRERLEGRGISVVMSGHKSAHPRGGEYILENDQDHVTQKCFKTHSLSCNY